MSDVLRASRSACVIPENEKDAPLPAGRGRGRPAIWRGEKLERLREAYASGTPIKIIAHQFGTCDSVISRLAAEYDWPMRRRKRA